MSVFIAPIGIYSKQQVWWFSRRDPSPGSVHAVTISWRDPPGSVGLHVVTRCNNRLRDPLGSVHAVTIALMDPVDSYILRQSCSLRDLLDR